MRQRIIDSADLDDVLAALDRMLEGRQPRDGRPGSMTDAIVDWLREHRGGAWTAEEIAEGVSEVTRFAAKRLSMLVGDSCPKIHRGNIERVATGLYQWNETYRED